MLVSMLLASARVNAELREHNGDHRATICVMAILFVSPFIVAGNLAAAWRTIHPEVRVATPYSATRPHNLQHKPQRWPYPRNKGLITILP